MHLEHRRCAAAAVIGLIGATLSVPAGANGPGMGGGGGGMGGGGGFRGGGGGGFGGFGAGATGVALGALLGGTLNAAPPAPPYAPPPTYASPPTYAPPPTYSPPPTYAPPAETYAPPPTYSPPPDPAPVADTPQPDPPPRRTTPSNAALVGALMGGTGPAFQAAQEAASGETLNATVTATPPPEGSSPTMAQMLAAQKQAAAPSTPTTSLIDQLSPPDRVTVVALQTEGKVAAAIKHLWPDQWGWDQEGPYRANIERPLQALSEKAARKAERAKTFNNLLK